MIYTISLEQEGDRVAHVDVFLQSWVTLSLGLPLQY